MGALPFMLEEWNQIVPPQTTNEGVDDRSIISDISMITTGPNTPEPHISPSPINATWALEQSSS